MDAVFSVKKKFVPTSKNAQSPVIQVHMFNVRKKLKYFVIVKKNLKLFHALLKAKKIFVVMKFVENN
jgi:hypothetical protein